MSVLLDRFQQRKRSVRVYLDTPETCDELRGGPTGELLGVCFPVASGAMEIHLNARQSDASLETTYVHELGHLVLDRLELTEHREEIVAECVEELAPILRRYAIRLPWSRIRDAKKRLGV